MLKRLILPLALAATAAAILPAQAQVTDCGMSVMVLPSGECLDLDYISILGASRRDVSQATTAYDELFEANVTLEVIYDQYPLLDNETEAEREERIDTLLFFKENRDDAVQSGQSVEDTLYPLHVYSMHRVGNAFR